MHSSKVRDLQNRLYEAAKANPKRRFHALRDKVQRMDVLTDAWKQVKGNKGAPGVDGEHIERIVEAGEEEFLEQLRDSLVAGTYRVSSVRRVYIDKPDGGRRPLGIPIVRDRVVQGALKIVIEPIFEADFKDCSYGYRPERSADDAHQKIRKHLYSGYTEVIDADIKGFFDNISHEILMREIERRIADGWVLKLIRAILRAKVIEPEGRSYKLKKGTPQGGVISPLFANIYLHQLDREWEASGITDWRDSDAQLIRYADDLVILTKGVTVKPMYKLKMVLGELGLELHPEKTKVVKARDGFEFLGFRIVVRSSTRRNRRTVLSFPCGSAMKRAKEKIKELTDIRKNGWRKPFEVIERLNQFARGWANYYSNSNAYQAFRTIQYYVNQRVRRFLRRRKNRKGFGYKEYPDRFLYGSLGLINLTRKGLIRRSRS